VEQRAVDVDARCWCAPTCFDTDRALATLGHHTMKPFPLAEIKIAAVLATACVWLGCEAPTSTASEQTTPASPTVAAQPMPPLVTVTNLTQAPAVPEPGESAEALAAQSPLAPAKLSERLQEVVKLAQSGVGDDVIVAYIQNYPGSFDPTPDQILYLTDLGISDVVVTALVNHHVTPAPAPAPSPTVATVAPPAQGPVMPGPTEMPSETTYNPEPPLVYNPPTTVEYVTPPPAEEDGYFYSSLAPYGSWIDVADYGWCWQPTVVVLNYGWRPYCDHGRWLNTDCGWYWQSDYSWGWAPFHYGRWFHHPVRGWCWRPDSVWSPAWVSWRYTDTHCGWAPLPPGAHYHEGVGFTYYGASVGIGFSFGLHHDAWTFVPAAHFHDHEVARYRVPPTEHAVVYRQSTVINDYFVQNHVVVNRGVSDRVPALARTEPRPVVVRDLPQSGSGALRPDRLHQVGAEMVVYRPKPPAVQQQLAGATAPRTVRSQSTAAGYERTTGITPGHMQTEIRNAPGKLPPGPEQVANARPTVVELSRNSALVQPFSPATVRTEAPRTASPQNPAINSRPGAPPTVTQPSSSVRQETPRTLVIAPQSQAPRPTTPTPQVIRSQNSAPAPQSRPDPAYSPPVAEPRPAPSYPTQTVPVRPVPSYAPSVAESRPAHSWSQPAESRPAASYSPAPVQSRPAPSYTPSYSPAAQSRPAPSYSPPPEQSRPAPPAPTYSAPAARPAQASGATSSANRRQN
jgi:hypothetical protein